MVYEDLSGRWTENDLLKRGAGLDRRDPIRCVCVGLEGPAAESEGDEGPDEAAEKLLREAPCWLGDRATRTEQLATARRLDEADARTAERTRLEEEDKDIVRTAGWGRGVEVMVVGRQSVVSCARFLESSVRRRGESTQTKTDDELPAHRPIDGQRVA